MEPAQESRMSPDKIKLLFEYDPETGIIKRSCDYGRGVKGQIIECGRVMIDSKLYVIADIIWVLHHGDWPPKGYWVDHKNRIRADTRIVNLRLATPTQNQQNKGGSGTYAKGVTWRNRIQKPWQAKIRVNGERLHLGSFATEEEAAEAYRMAALEHHGEFACP